MLMLVARFVSVRDQVSVIHSDHPLLNFIKSSRFIVSASGLINEEDNSGF